MKYDTRAAYVREILELQHRARRSGWNMPAAHKSHIASWLRITPSELDTHNRAYGITLDDIRAGRVGDESPGG